MKGDFARFSFFPDRAYTRVLAQQGRVQLDADWNEQISILWDVWRDMVVDLVGPHAGPHRNCGFSILCPADFAQAQAGAEERERRKLKELLQGGGDFIIGPGHYYVDGFLCRNDLGPFAYSNQPYLPGAHPLKPDDRPHLVYLDVWERHVTQLQDADIGEVALGGADTCTRAKLVWQVRTLELHEKVKTCAALREKWEDLVYEWRSLHRAYLRAMAKLPAEAAATEAPLSGPGASYRGPDNRLYRVEIHQPGAIGEQPTFKWSRDNGTVVFSIVSIDVKAKTVTLAAPGKDTHADLAPGDMVEIIDDDSEYHGHAHPLLRVDDVDARGTLVTLQKAPSSKVGQDPAKHPLLRRWDQKAGDPKRGGLELRDGAALIREGVADAGWMTLEDGVQVQFMKTDPPSHFATGDYWLVPARTATGDVIWPQHKGKPAALRPQGVIHYYAPLAIVEFNKEGQLKTIADCRPKIKSEVSV